jgi:hypothetical protein
MCLQKYSFVSSFITIFKKLQPSLSAQGFRLIEHRHWPVVQSAYVLTIHIARREHAVICPGYQPVWKLHVVRYALRTAANYAENCHDAW